MANTKVMSTERDSLPGMTPEARENQLIALAYDRAEQQIRDGTASSQVVSHFLKLGSSKEKLEREKLEKENELLRAKAESLQSERNAEVLYQEAINAMKLYGGQSYDEDDGQEPDPDDIDDGYYYD